MLENPTRNLFGLSAFCQFAAGANCQYAAFVFERGLERVERLFGVAGMRGRHDQHVFAARPGGEAVIAMNGDSYRGD